MRDAAEQVGLAADGTEDASARCRSTARVGRSAQAQRRAFAGGSTPPPACNGSALTIVSVVALALLGMGMAVHAREAPADDASERCRNAAEALVRVSACTQVLTGTRDKSKIGQAYNRRGHANAALENYEAAARDFAEVARLNPTVGGYQDNRAKALRLAGRLVEALDAADTAVRLAPGHAFVLRGRAMVHEEMGRLDLAVLDISRGMEIDPRDPGLPADRGRLYAKMVRDEDAIQNFTAALELDPTRTDPLRDRGLAYIRMGRSDAAFADLAAYAADHPDDAQIAAVLSIHKEASAPGGRSPLITDTAETGGLP